MAAERLISDKGIAALSFESLARSPTLKLTRTAPLYYFGSKLGLLAAVAEHGFSELEHELTDRLSASARGSAESLVHLAVTYGVYALNNPHLYRTMHATQLWRSASKAGAAAASTANARVAKMVECRDRAFNVFEEGVRHAQEAGRLRRDEPAVIARLLTTVVDGYLFQTLEEQVDADLTLDQHTDDLRRLVEIAIRGVTS